MNIICDHDFRKFVSTLNRFEMDLGRAYTRKDDIKNVIEPNIKDEFVLKFIRQNKRVIYKVGILGPISFYTYDILPPNTIWIYKNPNNIEEKIEYVFDKQLASIDFKKYFANIVYEIENKDKEKEV